MPHTIYWADADDATKAMVREAEVNPDSLAIPFAYGSGHNALDIVTAGRLTLATVRATANELHAVLSARGVTPDEDPRDPASHAAQEAAWAIVKARGMSAVEAAVLVHGPAGLGDVHGTTRGFFRDFLGATPKSAR